MKKKAVGEQGKQVRNTGPQAVATMVQQLVLPLIVGIEATKKGLLSFVHQMGLLALQQLLAFEATQIVGPKGKHAPTRTHNHWGTAQTTLPFGGRKIVLERPRVRGPKGEEPLPSFEAFREADPLPARVAEQIVLGVSTRGYARSLEPVPEDVKTRGASKSAASRGLIDKTQERVDAFLNRPLKDLSLVAMFIDGIEIAGKATIVALGVSAAGAKVPLGIWSGSTESAPVATALLQNLIDRGLSIVEKTLFVIDGGKGIRKAIEDVFCSLAVVQRCQVHKGRNIREHVPEARRSYVAKQLREAYLSKSAKTARKLLKRLASWLESNGDDCAAASLREGLEETLTVVKLGLTGSLARTFATTNSIENMNGTIRRIAHNVKRWRGEPMIKRWVALGLTEAQRKFRRVKGYKLMSTLVAALRPPQAELESNVKVA
jgi:putative transposase